MKRNQKTFLFALLALTAIPTATIAAAQTESADAMFLKAKVQARDEHKNILLDFSASWCGPCKLYEGFLEDPAMKAITERAFVVVQIDVGEHPNDRKHQDTPGGLQLRTALLGKHDPSYPILVITDADGKPLIDSFRNEDRNANIGYPDAPEEIDWYIEMLKRAAPTLTPAEIQATHTWLKKHSRYQ